MKVSWRFLIMCSVLLGSITFSCKKQSPPPDFHYDYFDLTPGRYVVYDVTEIDHDDALAIHDTLVYQLKTVIGDTVIDNSGRVARKFLRYTRNSAADGWVLKDTWTTIIDQNRAELVEENQRVIKLVFAPTVTKEWNANSFNMFPELTCYYGDIHAPFSLGLLDFDSTVSVEQEDFFSMIDYRRKYEVYAKGVGLVYKYFKDLKISGFDTLNVDSGDELFMRALNYGIE